MLVAVLAAMAAPLSAAAPALAQSAPAGYPVKGLDTSHWQHSSAKTGKHGPAINWASIRAAGYRFVHIKATQGTSFVDPWFATDYAAARAAGLYVAPYAFWDQTAGSGTAQASHFIAELRAVGYTGQRVGDLPPMLDLEGCKTRTTLSNVKSFITAVQNAFSRTPWVYTSRGEYSNCLSGPGLGNYPLIIADWADNPPRLATGWTSWLIWQYTDSLSVSGIPAEKPDGDVFYGAEAMLDLLANHCQTHCPS